MRSAQDRKVKRQRAGLKKMQLWWEFWKTPEAKQIASVNADRVRAAFDAWYVKTYPVESAIEFSARSQRIGQLVEGLLGKK